MELMIELVIAHSHKATGTTPTLQYLTEKTFKFIDAGLDTNGRKLAAAIYYILRTPGVKQKLGAKLSDCPVTGSKGERVDTKRLNNLEYLVGGILMEKDTD
jgi:hypothetical protein